MNVDNERKRKHRMFVSPRVDTEMDEEDKETAVYDIIGLKKQLKRKAREASLSIAARKKIDYKYVNLLETEDHFEEFVNVYGVSVIT